MSKIISYFILIFLSVSQVEAATYKYWVKIPATTKSCQDEALALGNHFAQVTDMVVNSAECLGTLSLDADQTKYSLDSILVTYSAKPSGVVLPPYSAVFGLPSLGAPSDSEGIYDSYSACLADLNAQIKTYEINTGLKSVAAYCQPALSDVDAKYVLKVDGFGKPRAQLFLFKPQFMVDVDTTALADDVASMVKAAGGVIAKTVAGAVLYYSKSAVPVGLQYLSFQDSAEHCNAQIKNVQEMFAPVKGTSVAKCLRVEGGGDYLAVLQSSGYEISPMYLSTGMTYSAFADCMSNQAQVVKGYQATGRKVVGALCELSSQANGRYAIALFGE